MTDSGTCGSGTSRPDGWPEMFSAAGESPSCPHQFVWDDADSAYVCVYCRESRMEPPERYVQTGTQQEEDA
jgi:hypothetical protein